MEKLFALVSILAHHKAVVTHSWLEIISITVLSHYHTYFAPWVLYFWTCKLNVTVCDRQISKDDYFLDLELEYRLTKIFLPYCA